MNRPRYLANRGYRAGIKNTGIHEKHKRHSRIVCAFCMHMLLRPLMHGQLAERLFCHARPLSRLFHRDDTVMHEFHQYFPAAFGISFSLSFFAPLFTAFFATFLAAFFFTAAQFHIARHILHLHFFVFFRCVYSICDALGKLPCGDLLLLYSTGNGRDKQNKAKA